MSEENLNVHSNLSESEIPVESKETDPQSIESAVSSDITSSLENVEPEGTDFDIHPELENSVEASSELEPVAQVVSEISQDSETNEEVESVTTPIPDDAESAPIVAEDT